MAITIEQIGDVKNQLGEGPVWDVAEKALYWIDGSAPAIYRLDPKTGDIKTWKTPKPIGSFGLLPVRFRHRQRHRGEGRHRRQAGHHLQ
jgi:sugar lactone lactonase YvrE